VILGNLRVHRLVRTALLATIGTLLAVSSASAHTIVRKQSDFFWQSTPLTYTPGRGTPAIAETTIRHQVYFSDLEGSTAGWSTVNFRANKPVQWAIVSGAHACTGNSWWCGQVGLPHGDGYGNNWIQSLTTAVPINIAGSTSPQLTFKMRLQSEQDLDIAWVLIRGSNPGARWDTLAFYSGNAGTSCVNKTLAIPDSFKTVTQPIALQFLFGSDISFSAEDTTGAFTGWSLDDIAVSWEVVLPTGVVVGASRGSGGSFCQSFFNSMLSQKVHLCLFAHCPMHWTNAWIRSTIIRIAITSTISIRV